MLSAVIPNELSYSAMHLAVTADRPEVYSSRSSRTREESSQAIKRLRQIETNLSYDGLNPARVPL